MHMSVDVGERCGAEHAQHTSSLPGERPCAWDEDAETAARHRDPGTPLQGTAALLHGPRVPATSALCRWEPGT